MYIFTSNFKNLPAMKKTTTGVSYHKYLLKIYMPQTTVQNLQQQYKFVLQGSSDSLVTLLSMGIWLRQLWTAYQSVSV